ncbi:LLM class flavin-dependent oxidoreductase [Intrasporangium sp.]|uniref:LLM class flavin-dependent oxidoreductase n=1 Tax=Intrasporangium sp. TaxID=1925024 RepID=UPI00293A4EEF|nr:LLM class flavin-dependent oxidoreductase [Intrasporangium sp.]MDV3220810.1 LLM class flavin-dependent oxidoreductase [Intrasporangium sp.]
MRFGFVVPYAAELEFADLAEVGEQQGWDGIFTWEALYGIDAWVELGAAAMATSSIRLGTLLTPASRHRPWDLASKVGSVDRISGGRAVMSVGLGALHPGWLAFEADEGRAVRAKKLDESLAIFAGLLGGDPEFTFSGEHYSAGRNDFMLPPPTPQRPHPPVWVVGSAAVGRDGRQRSLERAARWQGVIPAIQPPSEGAPKTLDQFAAVIDGVRALRAASGLTMDGYDAVIEADSHGSFTALEPADPEAWEQAGATWWIESWWDLPEGPDGVAELRRRVEAGPPRR